MIGLIINNDTIESDVRDMIYAFYFGEKIKKVQDLSDGFDFYIDVKAADEEVAFSLIKDGVIVDTVKKTGLWRNPVKEGPYELLSKETGKKLPWGILTGVRPTKLAMMQLEEGRSREEIIDYFLDTYHCTRQKAEICTTVALNEQELMKDIDFKNTYSLYVGIPFCPTRCLYCSFTSYPIKIYQDKVEDYLQALFKEIDYVAKKCKEKTLFSVYFGGGTPSSITADQLERLINKVKDSFDMSHVVEFTVEAGRPDSITYEKLEVLKKCGVSRISINPQTMNQETLDIVGRAHSVEQTKEAFALARKAGHTNINMDMIVGLPGEDLSHVLHTLDEIRKLGPDSLTVHSLAVKRAAHLKEQIDNYRDYLKGASNEMLEAVDDYAKEAGLVPYYLYRQKNIPGNMENIGYARAGLESIYNILIMEEKQEIIAVGADASSKFVFHDEHYITRAENVKSVDHYMNRIDEMIERKDSILKEKY
ncbi:MAG: coproporphyrinogen dehydrogenase HemZ [Lachnospiraceae bacterium]|nr:coproporphyrinogen dehydrogenase HemZ [Lachnospiraceae bacterium]